MNPASAIKPAPCPHREMLEAFCVGRLSTVFLESIAQHVANCPACRAIVDSFPEDSDALISHLRACAQDRTGIDDPECKRLEAQACGIVLPRTPGRSRFEWPAPLDLPECQIRSEIGSGPHGVSLRALRRPAMHEVRLKRLFPTLGVTAERLEQFRAFTASVAAKCPRTLHVIETIAAGDERVVVTPWIEGSHLGRIIADRKAVRRGRARDNRHSWATLDDKSYLDRMQSCLGQVVESLAALHQAALSHGGVKPTNILVDCEDRAWLCDAGCHLFSGASFKSGAAAPQEPVAFVSPERWETPETMDARSDVFSMATLLYQALTLELPFGARRVQPTDAAGRPPSRWQPLLAAGLDEVLLGALQPNPRKRLRDARQLWEQWQRVQRGQSPGRTWTGAVRDFWLSLRRRA